jgi:hypothetical protein
LLAPNFLMDRSAASWASDLAQLATLVGACREEAAIVPAGAHSGTFAWSCERGAIEGSLLLAPTNPPTLQALRLRFVAR